MDAFMHMNNASYVRVAELSRWRAFPASGMFTKKFRNVLFLVAEQKAKYFKPINPFQKYIVRTTITTTENKWLHYNHVFMKPPRDGDKSQPVIYCVVDTMAVLKRPGGKTIKIEELAQDNEFYNNLYVEKGDKIDNSDTKL
jgi:acyl-CoA thioesterase FadM